MSEQKNRPAQTLRDGNIKATVWENIRDEKVMHSVQFRRSYRDQEGQYRDTDSFSSNDLLRLSRLAGQTYDALTRLRNELRKDAPSKDVPAKSRRTLDQDRER